VITRRSILKILAASPLVIWLGSRILLKPAAGERPNKPATEKIRLYSAESKGYILSDRVIKTDEEWKEILTPEQFFVLRQKGTERAFTGQYWHNEEKGLYRCAGCANDLFTSDTKFESGTGWPSFWKPIAPENVQSETDNSNMMERTEVECARCEGHLGHVFDDGPKPTGLRYCMNSVSLVFVKTA
jgi:peptide-methionine (R)-S-oxide reductase